MSMLVHAGAFCIILPNASAGKGSCPGPVKDLVEAASNSSNDRAEGLASLRSKDRQSNTWDAFVASAASRRQSCSAQIRVASDKHPAQGSLPCIQSGP